MTSNEKKYRRDFGLKPRKKKKARRALEHALDIRKFEISLYWQRAAYFWALIAAAFAGFFAILGADTLEDKEFLAFVVANIGLLFTWAWFLVNRGSKLWQENWENHVDMLENATIGPLYKTILRRPKDTDWTELAVVGPRHVSVSKINQWVSAFTIAMWLVLLLHVASPLDRCAPTSWPHILLLGATVFFGALMFWKGRTHLGEHTHTMIQRKTSIE